MAKNRNRDRRDRSPNFTPFHNNRVRDTFAIASDFADRTFEPVSRSLHPTPDLFDQVTNYISPAVRSYLPQIEDRRTFHPAGEARPTETPRRHPKVKLLKSSRGVEVFGLPKEALVCVRRGQRKEVLHALGKTGRGSSPPRRFSSFSKVRCP